MTDSDSFEDEETRPYQIFSFPSWLLGDHLGSTSMVADAGGQVISELRYSAFGEIRYQNGTLTTDYLYTGQRQEAEIGLYYYVARWYDPAIGRFIQADSIVPNPASAKGFDRYSYSYNSPLNYLDPSGHRPILMDGDQFAETDQSQGITNVISTKARDLTNNANNYKPLSKKNKNVAFPDKNYNHKSKNPESNSQNGCFSCTPVTPELPESPVIPHNFDDSGGSGWDNPLFEEYLKIFAKKFALPVLGFMNEYNELINIGKPLYRQVKFAVPTGALEATADALLQAQRDSWYESLTTGQRISRPTVVFLETLAIDRVAGGAGKIATRSLGVPTGLATNYLISGLAHDFIEAINPALFDMADLGVYP
jgi:RHS repeat-associated protein